jgi:undecaprenyl-diphosphatase
VIGLDRRLERWVVGHRVEWLNEVFVWLSRIGAFGLVWIGLAVVLALARRRPALLLLVVVADLFADLTSRGLKEAVGRERPHGSHSLVHVPSDPSFPSGHAATSFACALVLAAAAPRLAAPLFVLAAAIAFSRVYVGVHYPLDILGGAALGLALATALLLLAGARRRSRAGSSPG